MECPSTTQPCIVLPDSFGSCSAYGKRKYFESKNAILLMSYFFKSAEQLRVKSTKTMVALSAGKGIAIVAEAWGKRERIVGQHFAARGFG
jgi:hypothetical protein